MMLCVAPPYIAPHKNLIFISVVKNKMIKFALSSYKVYYSVVTIMRVEFVASVLVLLVQCDSDFIVSQSKFTDLPTYKI